MNFLKKSFLFRSFLFSLFLFFLLSGSSLAGAKLEVGLPGAPSEINNPAEYLRYIFIFSYSFIGFLAVVVIVYGGVLYSIPGKTGKAKEMILGALSGVALLFCSYLVLWLIDPSLTNLMPTKSLEKISVAKPPEAPSAPDDGKSPITKEYVTYKGVPSTIDCKTEYICGDLRVDTGESKKISEVLAKNFPESLGINLVITETTRNHGCTTLHSSDSCPLGGQCCASGCECVCNQSAHCSGLAVDIRTNDKNNNQIKTILEKLSQDSCVNDLFFHNFTEYTMNDGKHYTGSVNALHDDHIHFSILPSCAGFDF